MGEVRRIVVREFNQEKDCIEAEEVERNCEVGPSGKMSLLTHMLGNPMSRIRHSPAFFMLVAEMEIGADKKIVGLIRGCIKTVTCGRKVSRTGNPKNSVPIYAKLAYILGLRVSSSHRRMGIGLKLVTRMEQWFRENGAEYSYMATDTENKASLALFNKRCGYSKFRTPSILVQPVFAHRVEVSKRVTIVQLSNSEAEALYRQEFSTMEFFPRDIDSVLKNKLNLGTFLAVQANSWLSMDRFLSEPPESWAVLSIWNNKEVFMLEVSGASRVKRALAKTTRVMDRIFPWMGIPSVPNVFKPFGAVFLYGLGGNGPHAVKLMKALCGFAHNLARRHGCSVVATEVSGQDPIRVGIPHWKRLSCEEDLWCMKRLGEDYSDGSVGDWTKCPPGLSIFVDPREL